MSPSLQILCAAAIVTFGTVPAAGDRTADETRRAPQRHMRDISAMSWLRQLRWLRGLVVALAVCALPNFALRSAHARYDIQARGPRLVEARFLVEEGQEEFFAELKIVDSLYEDAWRRLSAEQRQLVDEVDAEASGLISDADAKQLLDAGIVFLQRDDFVNAYELIWRSRRRSKESADRDALSPQNRASATYYMAVSLHGLCESQRDNCLLLLKWAYLWPSDEFRSSEDPRSSRLADLIVKWELFSRFRRALAALRETRDSRGLTGKCAASCATAWRRYKDEWDERARSARDSDGQLRDSFLRDHDPNRSKCDRED